MMAQMKHERILYRDIVSTLERLFNIVVKILSCRGEEIEEDAVV